METYVIPVTFVRYGKYHIEANTLLEALDKVRDLPLPEDSDYLDGSLHIDEMDVIECNTESGGTTHLSDQDFEDLSEYLNEQGRENS